jgi:hypothetical protein
MQISLELSKQIKQRLTDFVDDGGPDGPIDLGRIVSQLDALPLMLDMGGAVAIRPDGEIISFVWDKEEDYQVENDRRICNIALFAGSKKYPELKQLIPSRDQDDVECPHCNGTGTLSINADLGVDNIVCYCGGLGWIPKERSS